MPVITIEFEDLNRLLAESITVDDFRKNIPLIGADPDYIDETGAAVEFFPDRPDLCSTEGVARALRPLLGQKPGLIDYPVSKSKTHMVVDSSVLVVRPVMMSCIVHNANFLTNLNILNVFLGFLSYCLTFFQLKQRYQLQDQLGELSEP